MKLSHFSLALVGLISATLSLASCSQDITPVNPSSTVSPSSSASPQSGTSPTPKPSIIPTADPSPTASSSSGPTISPSATSPSPPSATPTPNVSYGPALVSGVNQTNFTFRARVVTDKGDVLPVSKASFKAVPYNLLAIQQDLIAKNAPTTKPKAPQQSDAKYQQIQKVCSNSGCTTEQSVNMDAYRTDLQFYQVTTLPDWESVAYKGLEAAIKEASKGNEEVNLITDANGEAAMHLPEGAWYFSGKYTTGSTAVVWDAIPFNISSTTRSVELTR